MTQFHSTDFHKACQVPILVFYIKRHPKFPELEMPYTSIHHQRLGQIPREIRIELVRVEALPQHMEALRADGRVRFERTSTN